MMEQANPKISVIVPVYNAEAFLPACLDSLCGQTYQNLEIICVNDGSLDGSRDVLENYAAKDQRITVLDKPNGGLSSARNAGLSLVTGDYVMFLDSDDWIDSNTCEAAVEEAMQSGADLVFWNYIREFENQSKPRRLFGNERTAFNTRKEIEALQRRCAGPYGESANDLSSSHSFGTAWGKLYRASIVRKNGLRFIDTKIIGTEDELYNLEAIGAVQKAVYLPFFFSHYRKGNKKSLAQSYRKNLREQWDCLHGKMRAYLIAHQKDESFFTALDNRISYSIVDLGFNILRSNMSMQKKYQEIKDILSSLDYRRAAAKLETAFFSLPWKIFFHAVKANHAVVVFLLLQVMKAISGN